MNEHPILFSTPMVQANLEGRKTNTRRLNGLDEINENPENWIFLGSVIDPMVYEIGTPGKQLNGMHYGFFNKITNRTKHIKCAYGQPGDLLWVRETWFSTRFDCKDLLSRGNTLHIKYKADRNYDPKKDCVGRSWKPSIHMPKTAARIWSQVEEIRVERLQDISEEDAIAEGITSYFDKMVSGTRFTYQPGLLSNSYTAKREFEKLWCKINGEESWEANPWVWVVKYKILSTTGRP